MLKILLQLILLIAAVVSFTSGSLSIARYNGTPSEKLAFFVSGVVALCVLSVWFYRFVVKPISPLIGRWYRIFMLARSIERLLPKETDLERLEAWIKRHAPERPAETYEVNKAVCTAPILHAQTAENQLAILNRFREEISKTSLIWHRWHEVEGRAFDFDFDSFRFLNPDSPGTGLGIVKHHLKNDILDRFRNQQFHTIVYILRDKSNHRMGKFFEDLKSVLPCDDFIGFPLDPARREKDAVLEDELLKACAGKSILLIEPLSTDGGLDEAYEAILALGGIVNGVVVMFEVKGVDLKKLTNHEKLRQKSGQAELQGQIILDLKTALTETN